MSERIKIKLIHSPIGTDKRTRETVRALGLRRIGQLRELERTASTQGMLRRVSHLVAELKDREL